MVTDKSVNENWWKGGLKSEAVGVSYNSSKTKNNKPTVDGYDTSSSLQGWLITVITLCITCRGVRSKMACYMLIRELLRVCKCHWFWLVVFSV